MKTVICGYHQQESTIDCPGYITQMLFTSGCNFCCSFCHNQALWKLRQDNLSFDQLDKLLDQARENWCDAVCITGGEPTIHDQLPELAHFIKKKGFYLKLDTNGSRPALLRKLVKNLDFVAMDIKAPLEKYTDFTRSSIDIDAINQSIRIIKELAPDYEFRTTLVEGVHKLADAFEMSKLIKGAKQYSIQPFVPKSELLNNNFTRISRTKKEFLQKWKDQCQRYLPDTRIEVRA